MLREAEFPNIYQEVLLNLGSQPVSQVQLGHPFSISQLKVKLSVESRKKKDLFIMVTLRRETKRSLIPGSTLNIWVPWSLAGMRMGKPHW